MSCATKFGLSRAVKIDELMKEFIVKEGTGPFSRIIPLTFTGKKQEKESFFLMKVKK